MKRLICITLLIGLWVNQTGAQVHLQTGAAQYSIPLFEYSDPGNRIGAGVSLNYVSGNGIKSNDMTSSVGVGWALGMGGVITRIQNGEPDDQKQDNTYSIPYLLESNRPAYHNYRLNYYPDGYMYSSEDPSVLVDNGGGYNMLLPKNSYFDYKPLPKYLADREQDHYLFSFGAYTGYFVIGKNEEVKLLVDSKLKVEFVTANMTSSNIITRISEFHITDPSGIKYIFKDRELSNVIAYRYKTPNNFEHTWIEYINPQNPFNSILTGDASANRIVSSWHLSEILNPLTGKKIEFNYSDIDMDIPAARTAHRSTTTSQTNLTLQIERKKGVLKRINSIKCSDNQEVRFVYDENARKDLSFDRALTSVQVLYNTTVKYSWDFKFGYIVESDILSYTSSLTSDQTYRSRLCLLELQKKVPDAAEIIPPFSFEYHLGEHTVADWGGPPFTVDLEMPPPFSIYHDSWGYPNRSNLDDDLDIPFSDVDYVNVNWTHVWTYAEGALSYRWALGYAPMAGLIKAVTNPTGGKLSYDYLGRLINVPGGSSRGFGGFRVYRVTMYDGLSHDNDIIHEYLYQSPTGESSAWGWEAPVYQQTMDHRLYDCGPDVKPGQVISTVASALPGLLNNSGINLLVNGQNLFINHGTGVRVQAINSLIINIILMFDDLFFAPNFADQTTNYYSNYSTADGNTIPIQYKRATVVKKKGLETVGKIEHTFTSDSEFAIDVPTLSVANSKRPRFPFWAYGLPLTVSVFDKDGDPVAKTEYVYTLTKNTLTDNNFVSQKWRPNRMSYDCDPVPNSGFTSSTSLIAHDIYYPMYGRIELTEKKEYVYNQSGESTVIASNFEYSTDHLQLRKTTTTNSKGEPVETHMYYAGDYTVSGVLQTMKSATNNMMSMPVATQTIITKPGNNKYLLGGTVTEYGVTANGDIRPVKNYVATMQEPVSASSAAFSAATLIPGDDLYELTGEIVYNLNGLPAVVKKESEKTSTLFDYDGRLPVAVIQNAEITNIAYTSFETENGGGWTFNPLQVTSDNAVTGKRSLISEKDGGTTSLSTSISNERQYILSFWLKGDLPFMSGCDFRLKKSYLNESTGFTYYEYLVENGTEINFTNRRIVFPLVETRAFLLDEVRLYPVEALMTTTTYDPVFGKTSESDVNGRIVYYDYDAYGRLKTVRDENRNVIKAYEYNFKQ